MKNMNGILYVVSTPIGNLEDMTFRAIRVLKEVDLIAAEDTRHTGRLLQHFEIKNRLVSYHDFNKNDRTPVLIDRLSEGKSIALVSDAGTPGISDPGYVLITQAIAHGFDVYSIPGPSAAIAALSIAGLATDRFVFEGFLPVKKGRKTRFEFLVDEPRTIIFYESPHRIIKTLTELLQYFGEREVAVCRELTKKFEETIRGPLSGVISKLEQRKPRGEFVIILEGRRKTDEKNQSERGTDT